MYARIKGSAITMCFYSPPLPIIIKTLIIRALTTVMKKPMPARPRYLRQCFPSLLPSYLGLQTPQNCLHLNNPPHLRPTTAVFCSLSFQHFEPDPEDVRILQARVGNRGLGRDRTQRIYYAFRSCAGLFCTDEDGMLQEKAWACCDRKPVLSDFSPSILLIFH